MPQDKPPAAKGKGPSQPSPAKPDARRMYAPPPPGPPAPEGYGAGPDQPDKQGYAPPPGPPPPTDYGGETEPYPGGGGDEVTTEGGDYDESPGEGEGSGYEVPPSPEETGYVPKDDGDQPEGEETYPGGGDPSDDESGEDEDCLRDRVADAQRLLREAEAELAKHQQRAKLLESISAIVADYATQYPGLSANEKKLRDYRDAEEKCLVQILGPRCADRIDKIASEYREAIERLDGQVKRQEEALAKCRRALEAAKVEAAKAKAASDELMKPVASIAARLKAVEAFRAEVGKAHNSGDYAVAYWLLTDKEKLDGKLNGDPLVDEPAVLREKIVSAWTKAANAAYEVEAIDADIKARELTLKADRAELADRIKTLDERIRRKLSELDTHHAAAA